MLLFVFVYISHQQKTKTSSGRLNVAIEQPRSPVVLFLFVHLSRVDRLFLQRCIINLFFGLEQRCQDTDVIIIIITIITVFLLLLLLAVIHNGGGIFCGGCWVFLFYFMLFMKMERRSAGCLNGCLVLGHAARVYSCPQSATTTFFLGEPL